MNKCTGTEALSVEEGERIAAELGIYAPAFGRRMCTTCHGIVLPNSNGKLRKHTEGSNVTLLKESN